VLTFLTVLDIIVAIALTIVVIIQPSKEAGLGALGGNSQVFAGRSGGLEGLLDKMTTYLAVGFIVLSIIIAIIS